MITAFLLCNFKEEIVLLSEQNPRYNEIIFSKTQKQQIVNLYTNTNASTVKIGKIFNCSHKKIAKILDEFGIERKGKHRKYALNEKYFDEIDEPNKAYILGFLFADGYNSYSKGSITLSLQEDDFDILESIRKELKSENPLKFLDYSQKNDFGYHYKNQYKLSLNSIHMCEN